MLPKILKNFYERYPNVKVEVVEENSMRLEELLLEGKLDLAVIAMPAVRLKNEVSILKRDEILLIANKDHPVMEYVRPMKAEGQYWVDLEDTVKWNSLNNNITAPMAVAMAREGLGLAFTYRSCAEANENVRYLRIGRNGVFLDLGIAYPSGEYHSNGAKALEQVVREIYRLH